MTATSLHRSAFYTSVPLCTLVANVKRACFSSASSCVRCAELCVLCSPCCDCCRLFCSACRDSLGPNRPAGRTPPTPRTPPVPSEHPLNGASADFHGTAATTGAWRRRRGSKNHHPDRKRPSRAACANHYRRVTARAAADAPESGGARRWRKARRGRVTDKGARAALPASHITQRCRVAGPYPPQPPLRPA